MFLGADISFVISPKVSWAVLHFVLKVPSSVPRKNLN